MGSLGAHVYPTAASVTPTVFEVLAESGLKESMLSAISYILKVVCRHNNRVARRFSLYQDELSALLQLVLEGQSFLIYGSSLSEHFYGLGRLVLDKDRHLKIMSSKLKLLSLILTVLLPYIERKLIAKLESGDGHVQLAYVHTAWKALQWLYILCYSTDLTSYHSPVFQMLSLILVDASVAPPVAQSALNGVFGWVLHSVSLGLSIGAFFLQFLDWWYNQDIKMPSLQLPTPPAPIKLRACGIEELNLCPLCQRLRTNDTVVSVSGYVFCYPCIHRYVNEKHCCPVTGYPTSLQQLIKLYLPT